MMVYTCIFLNLIMMFLKRKIGKHDCRIIFLKNVEKQNSNK